MKKITEFILKHSILIGVITLIITVAALYSIKQNVYIETDLDKYMPEDHPAFVYSDKAEEMFDIRDAIMIAIENDKGIYNYSTLKKIKSLTKDLQKLDEIEDKDDVLSLYTADNIIANDEGLEIERFYKKVPKSKEKLNKLRDNVRTNEMIYKRLVSEDETASVIMAKIKDNSFSDSLYNEINLLAEKYSGDGDRIYVAGQPVVEGMMGSLMPKDMQKMFPLVMLLILIVLFITLRSIKGTIITILVVLISSIWTFGLMLFLGYPIYAITTLIPVMLIAIGVADGIHLYNHIMLEHHDNPDLSKKDLIRDMIKQMWLPVMMTSVTTAIGFLSLLTSEVYPIKYFAVFTGLGVMIAMVMSLVFIPAMINIFGLSKIKSKKSGEQEFFKKHSNWFTDIVINHRKIWVTLTIIILIVFGFGISKVWINSSFLARFPSSNPIVETDKFVNDKFSGTTTINVILEGDKKDKFKDPEVLRMMDKVASDIDDKYKEVGGSLSVNDFIKRMNKVLNEDRQDMYKIPDDKNLIAQYFLLYEMSGGSDNLWEVVDENFQTANLRFQLKTDNSKTLNSMIKSVEKYKPAFEKIGVKLNFAGGGYKLLVFSDLILEGQIRSLFLSFIIVIILLSLMFKSIKTGLIGVIPITITTVISFGVLGLFNIPLETTTALISSIAIGIGIDYAVHFIDRYKKNALLTGDKYTTVVKTMEHSGRAIAFNAVVVILGFLVLLFSEFKPNVALGAIVSLNMLTSFIGTITIMLIVMYSANLYFKKNE